MKNKNLIHLRFDYTESLEGKKDVLFVEQRLVESLGRLQNYRALKDDEFLRKQKIHRKIKETLTELKKINKLLPDIEMPEVERENKKSVIRKMVKDKNKKVTKESESIEDQIRDIQEKLKSLQ